jgi:CelD/BcsL family acetyltransferase involved in cellulose biosynthesis
MKKIEALGVTTIEDDLTDLDTLAHYNILQFGEHSHFNKPHRLEYLKELMNYFNCKILSIRCEGRTIAVGFAIVFGGRYYGLTSGHDLSITNLGKYLIVKRIEHAVKSGASIYEAGRHDYGWKEQFHFEKKSLYRI